MSEKKWSGSEPNLCNVCGQKMEDSCVKYIAEDGSKRSFFVDGRLIGESGWYLMCGFCHTMNGAGVGVGLGQIYDLETRMKIAG